MDLEQAKATLSTKALTEAQKQKILTEAGLLTTSNALTAEQQEQLITSGLLTSEQIAQIASLLGLETAENGALVSTKALNFENVKLQLTEMGIVGTTQAQILKMFGLSAAEGTATGATSLLTKAIIALNTAMMANPFAVVGGAILAVGAAAGLVAAGFAIYNNTIVGTLKANKKLIKSNREVYDSMNEDLDEASSNASSLKSLYNDYITAKKGSDEYYEAVNAIAELSPELVIGYDNEGNAILANNEKIKEQIDYYNDLVDSKKEALKLEAYENIEGESNSRKELQSKKEELENRIAKNEEWLKNADDWSLENTYKGMTVESDIKQDKKLLKEYSSQLKDSADSLRNYYTYLFPTENELTDGQKAIREGLLDTAIDKGMSYYDFEEAYKTMNSAKVKNAAQNILNLDKNLSKQDYIDQATEIYNNIAKEFLKTDEQKQAFKVAFGIDEDTIKAEEEAYNNVLNATIDKFGNSINIISEKTIDSQRVLQDEYNKIKDWGLEDYSSDIKNGTIQSVFGNVDMDKRTIIEWSDELKNTYQKELASWDYNPEVGSIDTVFGGSDRFGEDINGLGWQVAFTPILPDGTFLSKDAVYDYIENILIEAYSDDGKITEDELKAIDAQGRQVGNTFVKGIFAGIDESQIYENNGNWAEVVGRLMHFSGDYGAVGIAQKTLDESKKLDKDYDWDSFFKEQGIDSKEEYDKWLEIADGVYTAEEAIKKYKESFIETNKKTENLSFIDRLSKIESLSDGLDQLADIYEDIKDGGNFDYSSILNNEDFDNAFKEYTEEYNNFIETIANSPNDINACQQSFNNLVKAYIFGHDAIRNVTAETRNSAILLLKQMGVENAQQIVDQIIAVVNTESEILNAAEEEYLEAYEKYLVSKDKADLEYLKNSASNNGKLVAALGSAYKQDYDNWCDLLSKKAEAYNKLVAAIGGSYNSKVSVVENLLANGQEVTMSSIIKGEAAKAQYEFAMAEAKKLENALKLDLSEIETDFKVSYKPTGGSSSGSGSETEEVIDHIATKIERLERKIESLGKTASATYKDWEERNNALSEQISKTTEEIALQEEALAYYQKKANSVGLSKEYQDLVKHGAIKVDTIKDEKLSKKIQEYQEWYDKILACEDAVEDLNAELANLAKQKFDNISSEFDNKFSSIEHEMNVLEALIDQTETRGHIVSTKYYESLIESEKKNIELLEQEYEKLTEELSNAMDTGDIKEGSEDWYTMKESINEVKLEIIETNTSLIEFENSIRDLEWENFDRLQEKISAITDETEFLISLMEDSELYDDNGQLTDTGMATMGLHAQNYNVLMNQADQYADEIEKINADLANDPNNQELLDRKQELIELQRESILAANDEKMAIKDMVQEGINLELEALQERIDKIKETQEEMQTLYEYQKKVAEQTKNIASLEKQLVAYEGDDSEENQAKIQQIKVELEEARKSLEETETEYALSETQKMLDNLYSEYEEILNTRLDDIDALLSDIIAEVNNNASNISETLNAQTEAVGATLSENMQSIWGNDGCATGIITKYGDNFNSQLTSVNNVLNAIAKQMGAIVEESDKEAESLIKEETKTPEPVKPAEPKPEAPTTTPDSKPKEEKKEIKVGGKIDAGNAKIYDYAGDTTGETQYYKNDPKYVVLKEKDGYLQVRHHSLKSGISGWFKKKDVKAYKTGGLAEETGLAWLDGTKSKPEMVLNAKDTKNYMELTDILRKATRDDSILFDNDKFMKNIEELSSNLKPEFNSFIAKLPHMNTDGFMGNMNNVFNMNFELHEVQSGRDVVNFLIKDKTFENAIQAMTVDRLAGGSKFAKSKYYKG